MVSIQAVSEILLAIVNHFPLFAVMLRFKDPKRLPGNFFILHVSQVPKTQIFPAGVRFDVCGAGAVKGFWERIFWKNAGDGVDIDERGDDVSADNVPQSITYFYMKVKDAALKNDLFLRHGGF